MAQTRRVFLGSAVAAGAAVILPYDASADPAPLRQSLEAFSRDAARVASLRKGVAVMKARKPSDHTSWFFQAAVHAYNDAAYAEALASDPDVAKVDAARFWNKCPHFGASSADFLVWHRAYLFYFERILRDAAGDPSLALPYWDYSKPANRAFPQIFADAFLDHAQTVANPLYHPNREQAFVTGRFDISAEVGEAEATMAAATFFSDVGTTGFGGDILDSTHTGLGLIEQRPHNDIHIAVGGVVGSANGAMADVPTAAFDPVFWVHHSNIDRLWANWSCSAGKSWGPLPPSTWLDEQPWEFLDVDGTPKQNSRRFFMMRENIPVAYDTDAQLGSALALPPPPVMAAAPAGAPRSLLAPPPPPTKALGPQLKDREILADETPLHLSPSTHITHVLPRVFAVGAAPPIVTSTLDRTPAPTAAAPKPKRVLLELSDITFARVPSSGFAVYLASSKELAASESGTFVGLLDLFGSTHGHMAGMEGMAMMGAVQRFDVTSIVDREGLGLTLKVEPYELLVSKAGEGAPARSDDVRIGKVRFVEVT